MPNKTIKVCVRTRPTATFAAEQIVIDGDKNSIVINKKQTAEEAASTLNNAQTNFKFQFHHVLHNASQDTVYETLARDVVQDVVDGINGTIMTYGQTGSGKTFTMLGDMNNYMHRGIAPRCIAHVFAEVGARIETAYRISCTYMEIYNERIFDLLKALSDEDARAEYTIAEERGGRGVFVRGLTEVEVSSEAEALNLLYSGQLARTTAQHKLNRTSNRSHSIFTIVIQQQSRSGVSERVVTSKLNLVDLAGSERLKKTMESSDGASVPIDATLKKESMYINQSLTYLEQCVVALGRRGGGHVAYRQTKLTSVLKDALGGNCATLLFACMWGEAAHLEETVSTLRLASRMMRVQNSAHAVEQADPAKLAKRQELTIRELRQELLMHDALADRSGVKYDPYTPEEQRIIAAAVRRYATAEDGKDDAILEFESAAMEEAGFVGDAEAGRGISIGRAAGGARPPTTDMAPKAPAAEAADRSPDSASVADYSRGGAFDALGGGLSPESFGVDASDKGRAFEHYKRGAGAACNAQLAAAKQSRGAARGAAKRAAVETNDAKLAIDAAALQLRDKRAARRARARAAGQGEDDDDVVDEEEFFLMKAERDAKRAYRDAHGDWIKAKADHETAKLAVEATKAQLLDDFHKWFADVQRETGFDDDGGDGDDDKLDDQEQFDKMEMERIVSQDPDALAFFQAQKTRRANMTQNRTHLRQLHRNKRA
ncbi:hypothetical protein JL721_5344 [Aureococcus anophagefferens]|nr:hypothetical protein JL721_5344 [Aureococcus anophagefferens]